MVVVLDNNVLISSLLGSRICRSILSACLRHPVRWVTSETLIEELEFVLLRPKFKALMAPADIIEMFDLIHDNTFIVKPAKRVNICRDPKDNAVIEAAIAAKATFIVSGDKDLLTLKNVSGVKILSPRPFLELLRSQ